MKKKLKKIMATALISAMVCSLAGCGSASSGSSSSGGSSSSSGGGEAAGGAVEISLYTTIPGKDPEFEEIVADFMAANQDIKVNYIAYDSSEKQKWMTLYSGGNAPTVSIMDAIDILDNVDNMAEFSPDDDVLQGIKSNYTDVFSVDGKIYGVPDAVQAMGLIYNKTTIEAATGESFDPASIKSLGDLEALCEKIQAGGVAPLMLTGVDWSLGSHFLSQAFTGIRGGGRGAGSLHRFRERRLCRL